MRKLFWDFDLNVELARRWLADETSYVIAAALGTDPVNVRTQARRLNLPQRALSNRAYPVEHDAIIRARLAAGIKPIAIAAELGRSQQSIYDARIRMRLPASREMSVPPEPQKRRPATPGLRLAVDNGVYAPRRTRPQWAGAPRRTSRPSPTKMRYVRLFLAARWDLDTVAGLFDIPTDTLQEALQCAS